MPSIRVLLALLLVALMIIGLWLDNRRQEKKDPPIVTAETSSEEDNEEEKEDKKESTHLIKKLRMAPGRLRDLLRLLRRFGGLIAHPERAEEEKGLLRLVPFFLAEKMQVIKALVLVGITAFLTLIFGVFARALPNAVTGAATQLVLIAAITIGVNILNELASQLGQRIMTRWSAKVVVNINDAATRSALEARYEVHLRPETKEVVNGAQATRRQELMSALNFGLFAILSAIVGLIAATAACLLTNWSITSVILVMLFVCTMTMLRSSKIRSQIYDQKNKILGKESVTLGDAYSIPGIQERKTGGRDFFPQLRDYASQWSLLSVRSINHLRRSSIGIDVMTGSMSPIIFLLVALMEGIGLFGKVSLTDIIALQAQVGIMAGALLKLTYGIMWVQDLRDASRGFGEMLGLEQELPPSDDAAPTPNDPPNRHIQANGLKFAYRKEEPPVIKGASCEIEPGDFVTIIGKSGEGKSTIAQILAGLLHPQVGEVLYGDHYLHALRQVIRYGLLTYMGQQAPAFRGTIREQFTERWGEAAQDSEINAVLIVAGLWDELQAKKGLETSAESLSGGQKQRLHFALCDFKVQREGSQSIFVDEGTSDLDPVAELLVVDRLRRMAGEGCTVIQVAHRVTAINAANKILAMEGGKATLMTIEEARQNPASLYYRLVVATGADSID